MSTWKGEQFWFRSLENDKGVSPVWYAFNERRIDV